MRHRIEFAILLCVAGFLGLIHRRVSWVFAGLVAQCAVIFRLGRWRVAMDNLRFAYPELNERDRNRIARRSIRHLIQTFLELPRLARASASTLMEELRVSNVNVAQSLLAKHRRVVFLSAHYGNWELAALSGALQVGVPFTIVGKDQRNPYVTRYLNRMRERQGNVMIPMQGALRAMIRALNLNNTVGLLVDQSGSAEDVFVPFFGRDAATTTAVAALSLKFDLPIILGLARRETDLRFTMEFVEVDRSGLTGTHEQQVRELTARHVRLLEQVIRKAPEQWLWMHKRWKHQLPMGCP